MRWAQIYCAPSTTSSPQTEPTSGIGLATRRYDETQLDNRLHRQRRAGAHRPATAPRQGQRTSARCVPSASVSASPTPSTWHGSSTRPGSPLARSVGRRLDRSATRHSQTCARATSTSCSRPTSSTRVSTCRRTDTILLLRPTESATVFLQQLGRGLRRTQGQGSPDRPRLRRVPPQGVSLRPETARHDGRHSRRH